MRGGGLTSDIARAKDFRPKNLVSQFLKIHNINGQQVQKMRRHIMPPGRMNRTVASKEGAQVLGWDNGKVIVRR